MNHPKVLLVSLFLLFFIPISTFACGYSYISQCSDFLRINADGSTSDYNLANCTYRATFQNKDFGTVENLSVDLIEAITWESCTNNVMAVHFYYRIYPVGTTPGAFNDFPVNNIISQSSGTYRTKKRNSTSSLNIAGGLSGGNYVFEAYIKADVDSNDSGAPNDYLTTDNNGNYFQSYFTIEGGTTGGDLTVDFENVNSISCNNGNDGTATATVSNGASPYSFAWSTGNNTATVTNLTVGNYFVTVTDANNLTGISTVSIQQPVLLQANTTFVNASSVNAADGSATATAIGGTGPFSFLWSNNQTTSTINNLPVGNYSVTVTDNNNCTTSNNVTVSFSATGPSGYCTATGVFPWLDWMTRVEFSGINNTSIKTHYSDYSTQNALVNTGNAYSITIENGFSWQTYDEYFRVWIDYNRNGVFEEPAEIAFSSTLSAPPLGTPGGSVSGNILIPANASLGTTRMRVSLKRGAYATPCENIPNGEVEDYSVTIESGVPGVCAISASATNITCNNAGTVSNPNDDTFSFALNVTGTDTGAGWSANVNGTTVTGVYGTPVNLADFPIANGNVVISVTDNADANCTDNITVTAPATCSGGVNCSITAAVSNVTCNDNGTNENTTDDTFTFNLNVTGTDTGTGWIATLNGTTMTGNYGASESFGPFPIAAGAIALTIQDAEDATCMVTENVAPPSACSEGTPPTGEENCVSTSSFPWFDWITGVEIGSISQPSIKSPYSDFTGSSTNLAIGTPTDIILTAGFSWFTYDEYWSVWIDYNKDNIFDETTELAYSTNFPAPPNGTLAFPTTGQITVPATAMLGTTKMRVTMKRDAAPTSCEQIPFGEVEDYSVNITAAGGNGFAVNNILRLEVNQMKESADISFFGLLQAEIISAEIEKSTDGIIYNAFSQTQPENFGDNEIYLRELDNSLEEGNNYYRVKLTAGDGTVRYSNPQLVFYRPLPTFTLYPNPAQDHVTIELPKMNGERVEVSVVGQFGQVLRQEVFVEQNERHLQISTADLIDGLYFLRVHVEGNRMVGKKLIISRL